MGKGARNAMLEAGMAKNAQAKGKGRAASTSDEHAATLVFKGCHISTIVSCVFPNVEVPLVSSRDGVRMDCTNKSCPFAERLNVHTACYEECTRKMMRMLEFTGSARNWPEKQREANAWEKKGLALIGKDIKCPCGKGLQTRNEAYCIKFGRIVDVDEHNNRREETIRKNEKAKKSQKGPLPPPNQYSLERRLEKEIIGEVEVRHRTAATPTAGLHFPPAGIAVEETSPAFPAAGTIDEEGFETIGRKVKGKRSSSTREGTRTGKGSRGGRSHTQPHQPPQPLLQIKLANPGLPLHERLRQTSYVSSSFGRSENGSARSRTLSFASSTGFSSLLNGGGEEEAEEEEEFSDYEESDLEELLSEEEEGKEVDEREGRSCDPSTSSFDSKPSTSRAFYINNNEDSERSFVSNRSSSTSSSSAHIKQLQCKQELVSSMGRGDDLLGGPKANAFNPTTNQRAGITPPASQSAASTPSVQGTSTAAAPRALKRRLISGGMTATRLRSMSTSNVLDSVPTSARWAHEAASTDWEGSIEYMPLKEYAELHIANYSAQDWSVTEIAVINENLSLLGTTFKCTATGKILKDVSIHAFLNSVSAIQYTTRANHITHPLIPEELALSIAEYFTIFHDVGVRYPKHPIVVDINGDFYPMEFITLAVQK